MEETLLYKICSKKYANRLSRNRHQLYCRKKSGQPAFRKSCSACRKAKLKCNSVLPCCGRCTEKNLGCWYEPTARSKEALVSRDGNLQNSAEIATSIPLERPQVLVPEPDLPSFFQQIPDNLEPFYTDNVPLIWDIDSGLGMDFAATFGSTEAGEQLSSTEILPFDTNSFLRNRNRDVTYDLDFGRPSSPGFDNPSLEICTVEFDTSQECMFNSPYLTFRYASSLPGHHSNSATLLARQSPFVETQDSRLGGNPIGRNLLLENIRSFLTMLSQPNLFPPFIHHSAFAATNKDEGARRKTETLETCRNVP